MLNVKKNKVLLSDYNYQRDIVNRILMSQLTVKEVEILKEILDNSLLFPINSLVESLNISSSHIIKALEKFSSIKLLKINGDHVLVDKEMRKYYEFQIMKFEDDFEPNVEYILSLLNKVPLHVLPNWYQLPKITDNIFSSLIEKYLQTPKIYEKYLSELHFDDQVLNGIMKDVLSTPHQEIASKELKTRYKLSNEQFEEYMLQLEYNFVCYIRYRKMGNLWEEFVAPIFEWGEYLRFLKESLPISIQDTSEIKSFGKGEFPFIEDLTITLKACREEAIPLLNSKEKPALDLKKMVTLLPHLQKQEKKWVQDHLERLLSQLLLLELVEIKAQKLHFKPSAEAWMKKNKPDQAMTLYRHPLNRLDSVSLDPALQSERSVREAEKSLKRVSHCGWVYLDDFIKGITAPIGTSEAVSLKQKGKKWRYALPLYGDAEKSLIENVIFVRLFESGITGIGTHQGKKCFTLTPFGRMAIGE